MAEEQVTLDGQFAHFASFKDDKRNGTTMTLWQSDYWMRQSQFLDDRKLSMTDTGLIWFKFNKCELSYGEWYAFLTDLCTFKWFNQAEIESTLINCGLPGTTPVSLVQFRDYFYKYQPKTKLI